MTYKYCLKMRVLSFLLLTLFVSPTYAQIEDNSFLLEEAYNQGEREVQHIFTFERDFDSKDWALALEQEWPLGSQAHQLSFELPLQNTLDVDGNRVTGLGDVILSYRYQALGIEDHDVAFAPRISLILPSGNADRNLGNGSMGYELGLPLSLVFNESLVAHTNASISITPEVAAPINEDLIAMNLGQSLIWLAHENFNVLVEGLWGKSWLGGTDMGNSFILNPGIRWAHNFDNGLQIVPGLSVPMQFNEDGSRSTQIFLYLSFEHGF